MIGQLARSMEMVVLKQLKLITAREAKTSGVFPSNSEHGPKIEFWVSSAPNHSNVEPHKHREFKITIEETT